MNMHSHLFQVCSTQPGNFHRVSFQRGWFGEIWQGALNHLAPIWLQEPTSDAREAGLRLDVSKRYNQSVGRNQTPESERERESCTSKLLPSQSLVSVLFFWLRDILCTCFLRPVPFNDEGVWNERLESLCGAALFTTGEACECIEHVISAHSNTGPIRDGSYIMVQWFTRQHKTQFVDNTNLFTKIVHTWVSTCKIGHPLKAIRPSWNWASKV